MDVVGTNFRLQDIYPLPITKRAKDLADFGLLLPEKHLPPEFGSENHMIFAVPRRMCHHVVIITILHFTLLVVCFADASPHFKSNQEFSYSLKDVTPEGSFEPPA